MSRADLIEKMAQVIIDTDGPAEEAAEAALDALRENLDYEVVANAIYNAGLPTSSFDRRGRTVPFSELHTGPRREWFRAARLVVKAALGEEPS